MKIAIQISGEFRTIQQTWPNVQKYLLEGIPGAEVDVFLHTWWRDEEGYGTFVFPERGPWHKSVYVHTHGQGLNLYKPRSYKIEKYEDHSDLKERPRSISMYYSIYKANECRKEYEALMDTKYDLVVRYRTDCMINENPFTPMMDVINSKKHFLCIPFPTKPKKPDGPVEQGGDDSVCDWFAYGTPETMEVYCGTYLTFKDFEIRVLAESMLALQLKRHGIHLQTILKRPPLDIYLVDEKGQARGI